MGSLESSGACPFCGLDVKDGDFHPDCLDRASPKEIMSAIVSVLEGTEPVIVAFWRPYNATIKRLKRLARAKDAGAFVATLGGLAGLLDEHDAAVVSALAAALGSESGVAPYARRREVYGWGQENRAKVTSLLRTTS